MSEAFLLGRGFEPDVSVFTGTTAPTDPAEDCIWVETEEPAHRWDFSPQKPLRVSREDNLIVYPYHYDTRSENGVSFTDVGDGSVSLSGTASADTFFFFSILDTETEFVLEPGQYTLSGCPSDGSSSKYVLTLQVLDDDGETRLSYWDYGQGSTFSLEKSRRARCYIKVYAGVSTGGAVFKPMLKRGGEKGSFSPGSAQGQLWIQTGSTSSVAFHAFPTGSNILLFPRICYQYISGAWKKKRARTYQRGAWRDWLVHLCKDGIMYNELSGGFTAAGKPYNSNCKSVVPTISYPDGQVRLRMTSGDYNSGIFYSKKVDLSEVNTVTVVGYGVHEGDGYAPRFCIWSSLGSYANQNLAAVVVIRTDSAKEFNLDVSALSGSYYLGFFLCASSDYAANVYFSSISLQ